MDALPDDGRPRLVLPTPLTSFVGRDGELGEVIALLDDEGTRLVTLTGPGGVGKTRLSLEVARQLERDFADGARFLRLEPIRDPVLVPTAVAQLFDVQDRGDRPLLDGLANALRNRHLLLVLDNFEHLLAEPPTWLGELLGMCPRLKVLVTSRRVLNIGGEHRYLVPPLPMPEHGGVVSGTPQGAAVELFVQRAQAVRSGFQLNETNDAIVEEICRRLDGLPLAIELAAARVNVFPVDHILSRLTDRFRLLARGQRDAPARLQSMHDAIAWSYDLLPEDEQRLFQRLSVFVGGFTLAAADAVVGEPADVVAGVTSLLDKSLLRMVDEVRGEPRYQMLETIREFGLEQLAASGEEGTVRYRHAGWCVTLARNETPSDPTGQLPWLVGVEAERDNLRAAIHWFDDTGRFPELAELVTELRWFWYYTGREAEGLRWYERVLQRHGDEADQARGDALRWAGHLAQKLGRPSAGSYLTNAIAMSRAAGDVHREAEAMTIFAILAEDSGDFAEAEARFRAARDLYVDAANAWERLVIDYHLGIVMYGNGELARAASMLEDAISVAEVVGDPLVVIWSRAYLALIACERRDSDFASSLLRRLSADIPAVLEYARPMFLSTAGVLASATEAYEAAARMFGAAANSDSPSMLPERTAFERAAKEARRQLGDEAYERAWEAGRRTPTGQIGPEIERLLSGERGHAPPRPAESHDAWGLTHRELQVLRLLADGMANQQIADTLRISRSTVAHHVASILIKLGVDGRTAAASHAIRHELA